MRKLREFFWKKPENQVDVQPRIELAFLILGGTDAERFSEMTSICSQHPELKHRFQVNECINHVARVLLTNHPLTPDQTEEYIIKLATKQNNIRQLSHPSLALS